MKSFYENLLDFLLEHEILIEKKWDGGIEITRTHSMNVFDVEDFGICKMEDVIPFLDVEYQYVLGYDFYTKKEYLAYDGIEFNGRETLLNDFVRING